MSTARRVRKGTKRALTELGIAKKVIAGILLVIGVPASAVAQSTIAKVDSISTYFQSEHQTLGCTTLLVNASRLSQKLGVNTSVNEEVSFALYATPNGENCDSGYQVFYASGFVFLQDSGVNLFTIDGRLTNAVIRATVPAVLYATGEPLGNLVLDLSFDGVTGQLSPYRDSSFTPSSGSMGHIVQHERGYERPAQPSGTAELEGVSVLGTIIHSPSATLFTRTTHRLSGKPRLLR